MRHAFVQNKILEVIVTSVADAVEAEAGGADRLEVVRDLADSGLTPELNLVSEIVQRVSIPIRVMIRENASMEASGAQELDQLCRQAENFGRVPIDGLVLGFIKTNDNSVAAIDSDAMHTILAAAPKLRATFHRAFDCLTDPVAGIATLKTMPQIDRILTVGGAGDWQCRKDRLHGWQQQAGPHIRILAGTGVAHNVIADLARDSTIGELHVGRAARNPPEVFGAVSRLRVAQIKGLCA